MARRPIDYSFTTPSPERQPNHNNKPAAGIANLPIRRASPLGGKLDPSSAPTGIKRTRAGRPRTPVTTQSSGDSSSARSYITPSCSEDEAEWPELSSGISDSDSDDGHDAAREYILPRNHQFQAQRPQLRRLTTQRFNRWRTGVKYTPPPDDRLPPRKRLKTSHWHSDSPRVEEEEDVSDEELVVVSGPTTSKGFFHLACPYCISNPEKHQRCLRIDDLQSIEGLINHLVRHHSKPPYCPICSETFDTIIHRDDHILENKCELRDPIPIEGINLDQRSWLSSRDKYYLGEKRRWRRIWSTVFPGSEPPRSPYLDQGCGLAVSMARDFWDMYGQQCVLEFLESRDLLDEDDERAHDALCKLALEDLLDGIIKEHEST
ncbi:hypothetical protein FDECE_17741 [Fusarium decemcellulare]|nr:hypothetical protein FDECE_17741 [Fusarium decemcellulare]